MNAFDRAQRVLRRLDRRVWLTDVRVPEVADDLHVAADAFEEAGLEKAAAGLRARALWHSGRRTPDGVSVPHEIFERFGLRELRVFLDVDSRAYYFGRHRHRASRPGASYAPPIESRHGPYVGPGGVFFVIYERDSYTRWPQIIEVLPSGRADQIERFSGRYDLPGARAEARRLARGGARKP